VGFTNVWPQTESVDWIHARCLVRTIRRDDLMPIELEGYEILEEIGRGGFAVVYRARQQSLDRFVAIKVLSTPDSDAEALRRFGREGSIVGSLSWHPHVVAVYDAGMTADGRPFLCYELMPGGSLAGRQQQAGRLGLEPVLSVGVQVADALEAACSVSVVHRDVKPSNVLIDRLGTYQLADFGIAGLTLGSHTGSRTLAGTTAYMAPEVISGEPATTAADIYSTGSLLFALLWGSPPFSRDSDSSPIAAAIRATTEPPPDLRELGVPEPLVEVVERALAKDPTERPGSAGEMAELLQNIQRDLNLTVTPRTPLSRFEESLNPDASERSESGFVTPIGEVAPYLANLTGSSGLTPNPATAMVDRPLAAQQPEAVEPRRNRRIVVAIAAGAVLIAALAVGASALSGSMSRTAARSHAGRVGGSSLPLSAGSRTSTSSTTSMPSISTGSKGGSLGVSGLSGGGIGGSIRSANGGTTGGSTGGATGGGTGGSTGASSGGTGASTGGSTGASTGGSAGGSTGGSTGASTGGSTGGSTGTQTNQVTVSPNSDILTSDPVTIVGSYTLKYAEDGPMITVEQCSGTATAPFIIGDCVGLTTLSSSGSSVSIALSNMVGPSYTCNVTGPCSIWLAEVHNDPSGRYWFPLESADISFAIATSH
jgi:serine/threonine protein kinase